MELINHFVNLEKPLFVELAKMLEVLGSKKGLKGTSGANFDNRVPTRHPSGTKMRFLFNRSSFLLQITLDLEKSFNGSTVISCIPSTQLPPS